MFEQHDGFLVAEKIGEAAEMAIEEDPRWPLNAGRRAEAARERVRATVETFAGFTPDADRGLARG
jgi:hypothetical protein